MGKREDTIKTGIELTGEQEYKRACESITSNLKTLGSEMAVVSAEYAGNAKSTEALKAKQDILSKKYTEQQKQVEAAEAALKKMREQGVDPTSKEYLKMEQNLNYAKAAMKKTENEIDNLSGELKKSKVDWSAVGNVVGKTGKAFATAIAGLGTAAVGAATALAGMTVSSASYADDLLTQSTNTHIATDSLQKYKYALNFIDGDMNTLTGTIKKNSQIMSKAASGNKSYNEAYKKLGISITDANGSLRNSEDVYWEVIDALGKIENTTERDAMAMTLLGKSSTDLNTVIDAGSKAFKAYGDEAEKMGGVMSGDNLQALGAFDDKLQTLKAGLGGMKNTAAMIALPFLDMLASDGIGIMQNFTKGIQEANGDLGKMGAVVGEGISNILGVLVERLPQFVEMGVTLLTSLISGIVNNADKIATAAVEIVQTLVSGIGTLLPLVINGAVQIVVGLATGLANALPQLIPQIVAMVATVVQTLVDNIPLVIDAALQLVVGLTTGIIDAIPVLVEALPQIIDGIINALLAAIPQIIQAGIQLISALVDALPTIIQTIVAAIPKIISGILTAVLSAIPLIIDAGISLISALVDALPTIIQTIVAAIPVIIDNVLAAITDAIPLLIDAGISLITALVEALPVIIEAIVAAIPVIIDNVLAAVTAAIPLLVEAGIKLITALVEALPTIITTIVAAIPKIINNVLDAVLGALPLLVQAGIDLFIALIGALPQIITAIVNAIPKIISGIVKALMNNIGKLVEAGVKIFVALIKNLPTIIIEIVKAVPQIVAGIVKAFGSLIGEFAKIGGNLLKGIWNGIKDAGKWLWDKISGFFGGIVDKIKNFFGIHSPSRMFAEFGEYMVQGLGVGFEKEAAPVTSAITKQLDNMGRAFARHVPKLDFGIIPPNMNEQIQSLNNAFDGRITNVRAGMNRMHDVDGFGFHKPGQPITVIQNIYANETDYAKQQKEAARRFKEVAREVQA